LGPLAEAPASGTDGLCRVSGPISTTVGHPRVERYFSLYLGRELSCVPEGKIVLVPCRRREKPEAGWARAEAVWIHIYDADRRAIISARPDLVAVLGPLLADCNEPTNLLSFDWREKVSDAIGAMRVPDISRILYCQPEGLRAFECQACRRLGLADIPAFVRMKLAMYPACDPECLARDLRRNIQDGIAFGVFEGDALVSAAEAPVVAHMQDEVEEVGVDTLPGYRGRGYGKAVVSQATRAILEWGRVPIYRCRRDDEPSLRLATAVGYRRHADKVGFRLED